MIADRILSMWSGEAGPAIANTAMDRRKVQRRLVVLPARLQPAGLRLEHHPRLGAVLHEDVKGEKPAGLADPGAVMNGSSLEAGSAAATNAVRGRLVDAGQPEARAGRFPCSRFSPESVPAPGWRGSGS